MIDSIALSWTIISETACLSASGKKLVRAIIAVSIWFTTAVGFSYRLAKQRIAGSVTSANVVIPAKAREYVFTGVGFCVCLSVCLAVCDYDN